MAEIKEGSSHSGVGPSSMADCQGSRIKIGPYFRLKSVFSGSKKAVLDSVEFVEYWNLEEEEGLDVSQMKRIVQKLSRRVDTIKCK